MDLSEEMQPHIDRLRQAGFNPIAVSFMLGEYVFVFETDEEAHEAFIYSEVEGNIVPGWWYSRQGIKEAVDWYERAMDVVVEVYWLVEQTPENNTENQTT